MNHPLSVHYPRTKLEKIHKQFFHPSTDKIFNHVRRAKPHEATPDTRDILEEISSSCVPCKRIQTGPKRFRVTICAEETIFNERVMIYVMSINNSPILHVVD